MNTARRLPLGPRLLAGTGALALLAGLGLAASRPAHTAGGPVPVSVTNTPLRVTDAAAADGQPFTYQTRFGSADGDLSKFVHLSVPAGKRLVVETIGHSRLGGAASSRVQLTVSFQSGTFGAAGFGVLPVDTLTGNGDFFPGVTTPVRFRADPGTTVTLTLDRNTSKGVEDDDVTVSGYLVDVP